MTRGDLEGASALAIYTLALAVHFVVTDFGLRDHHKDAYTRTGAGSSPPACSGAGRSPPSQRCPSG